MSICPGCRREAPVGSRWCGICHSNLLDASVGQLASPVRRLFAHGFDIAIPIFSLITILGVAGASAVATGSETGAGFGMLVGFALLIAYVVWAITLFAQGTTPGKNLLGLRVVKETGEHAGFWAMLVREWIGKWWISQLILGLGFVWILLDRDRQGWHDKLMSTYVVQSPAPSVAVVEA
jgi:uncharacterized RDD family membrane protein YckC